MALCKSRVTEIGMMDAGAGITRRKGVATIVPDAGETPVDLVMEWTVINHDNISSFVAMKKYTYRASNLANSNRAMISDSGFYCISFEEFRSTLPWLYPSNCMAHISDLRFQMQG